MNYCKKTVCAFLAAALFCLTGCSGKDLSWVYRSGELTPPAGVYLINMLNSVSKAESRLSEAGEEFDKYKDMLSKTLDSQPVSQWILAESRDMTRKYLTVERMSAERGILLSDAEIAEANNTAESTWQYYGEFYEKNGVALSSLRLYLENNIKKNLLFQNLCGEGGELAVSEQELREVFKADYARVGYMVIVKAAEDGEDDQGNPLTVEQLNAEYKKTAEGYIARLRNGEALDDLIYEQEKAQAGENADEVTKPEPGSRELIVSESMKNVYFSAEMVDGAMALADNEIGLVEDSDYYYVFQKRDILENPDDISSFRADLLSGLKGDEFEEKLGEWAEALDIEVNQAAVDHYKPSRLNME